MSYTFEAVIKNQLGIHARTAALLAKTVSKYDAEAYILFHGDKVNIKHLLDIISLSNPKYFVILLDEPNCSNALLNSGWNITIIAITNPFLLLIIYSFYIINFIFF